MINKLKVTFLLVTVLAASSCSELEDAVNSNLSTNQITYKVETLNEWNKVESSAKQARTRAAMPASGDVVKRVNGWSGPLYLHALEEPGIHIRDYKDRPVNKQGQLLADENTGRIIATRGSKVTATSLTKFGINVKRVSSDNSAETFIDNEEVNEEVNTAVDSKYKTSADHFWPSDDTSLSFYGYYPYNSGDYSRYISVNNNNTGTTPVITYKSTAGNMKANATDVKAQPDLCVAATTGQTRSSKSATPAAVDMTFNHALTAITFAVGSDMVPGTFKSITISGVYLEGDYTYGSGWSTINKPKGSITLNLGPDGNGIKRSSKVAVALTGQDSTLLMVPQTVPDGATISMDFDDGNGPKTFTANIGGTPWTAGSTIIYKLSTKDVNNMALGTITFPTTWDAAGYPKKAYDSGESMGLYSVDDLGNLRAQNVRITCKITDNGKSWTPASNVRFSPRFKYFVYYPFNDKMSSESVTPTASTAEEFFGNYTNIFQITDNQSSATDLEKNDLQVGMGTADNTASKVEFSSMEHSMGLAHVKFLETSVVAARLFNSSGTKLRDVGTATVYACETFTPNSYSASSHNFLRIGKPGSISFAPSSSSTFTWDKNSVALTANTASTLNVTCSKEYKYRGVPTNFDYTGSMQNYSAVAGTYLLECWGASGSDDPYGKGAVPGNGGYVAGCITFGSNTSLYIYVGGKGTSLYNHDSMTNSGGWNGGGFATAYSSNEVGGGGGGSTDIRIIKHSDSNGWSGTASLRSRIIVGGGGGGCESPYDTKENGGNAGGLIGNASPRNSEYNLDIYVGTGGTQTSGGTGSDHVTKETNEFATKVSRGVVDPYGHFGYASQVKPSEYAWWSGGAGGGWYGGANGFGTGGAGGSSFISGMTGCVAITADGKQTSGVSTMTINGKTYTFTSPVMKGGGESMPKHDGTSRTMTGNYGNGYAIITQLSY